MGAIMYMNEVNSKSPELLVLEEKDRRTNLKKFCNSILQKIGELDIYSGDRAIWELCQNARDLSEGAEIKISLENDCFTFAHKGRPFNEDSLLSLVKQVSSEEKENDDAAGQFGTGFVTTHYFNRKFYLNGSFQTESGKVFDINHFEIDRSEDDINRFIDKMDAQIKSVYNLLNTKESTIREWTELIYPLNEKTGEIALRAIRSSERTLPIVLVLNDKIKSVELYNPKDDKHIIYTKGHYYIENDLIVQEVTKSSEIEPIETAKIYYLQSDDFRIILPLESSTMAKSSNDIAKLFIWFPLLGTESWGTNFIYHSSFYPLEKRNGMYLPCDNPNVQRKFEYNVAVLKKMNALLFDYLRTHARLIDNSIELAKVDFLNHIVDDVMTKDFYKCQQEICTKVFRSLPLIETPKRRKSLDDGVKIPDAEICSFFTDEDKNNKYFDAFYEYASAEPATLPNKDICLKWANIIHQWGLTDESQHEISLADVAQKVTTNKSFEKLHNLLEIIKEIKQTKLFETMALIPNRKGELRTTLNLCNGKNIPEELYKRSLSICPTDMDKLVNPDFSDIYSLNEYTRDQLRLAVNNANDCIKTSTIRIGKCFSTEYTSALRVFVSIYSTDNPTSYRHQIMQCLSEMKGFEYNVCYIPKAEEKENDYCLSAFIFLLESELLDISIMAKNSQGWLEYHKEKLQELISKVALIKDSDLSARLLGSNGYEVIPNQVGIFCKLETLKIRDEKIPDELADLYYRVKNQELRETWADEAFSRFIPEPEKNTDNAKDIASAIETSLLEDYDNNQQVSQYVIDIIQKIESKSDDAKIWKDWFKHIDEKKADLNWHMVPEESKSSFYRLMKVAKNKNLLEDLADISENESLLNQFKEFMHRNQQEKAEFEFKYHLGKHIERLIREKLSTKLGERLIVSPTIEDRQCGQDLVVQLDGTDIFFVECKAKWNFSEPAHMSKLQIRKAFEERGRYALCAVDLTDFNALSNEVFPSIDEIVNHIHIHLDIADKLTGVIEPLFTIDDESDETRMTISADYRSNIPKFVFVNNVGFDCLINAIVNSINVKMN